MNVLGNMSDEQKRHIELGLSELCKCGHLRILHAPYSGPAAGHGKCQFGLSNKKTQHCSCEKYSWKRNL